MSENTTPAIGDGSKELLLFQMGPVQEFIAKAATPSDLWAGSYLLSRLILAGIKNVPDYKDRIIFPNLHGEDNAVEKAMEKDLIPSIPNRFLAFVPSGEGQTIASQVKTAIKNELDSLGKDLPAGAQMQLDQFLQMTWAILPTPTGDMGRDYWTINRLLAKRRNVREFDPWQEEAATKSGSRNGPKDFLSGKETALADGLGAMNLLKRRLPGMMKKDIPAIKSEDDKYLAIIAMDGDKMGATLSNLNSEDRHRDFSKRLAEFAREAQGKIEAPGVLVYAGGDDVLAAVPAKKAINTAKALASAFKSKMDGFTWKDEDGKEHPVSASVGIAIGHDKTPLLDLVCAAQNVEHQAKTLYGRNALALTIFKRSGETLEWGCNWDSRALSLHGEIVSTLNDDLSARFPYKLADFLMPYNLGGKKEDDKRDLNSESVSDDDLEKIVLAELGHVWERSSKEGSPVHEDAEQYLHETFQRKRPQDFLNLFLCETFINRQRAEED